MEFKRGALMVISEYYRLLVLPANGEICYICVI